MRQNIFWYFLYAISAAAGVWFTALACYNLYFYMLYNTEGKPQELQWSVVELPDERFVLHGKYLFFSEGTSYQGESHVEKPSFRNAIAAEKAIPKFLQQPWKIWYSASFPQYSTLQKSFPLKECLSSVLLWSLFIYFVGLRKYVRKLQQ